MFFIFEILPPILNFLGAIVLGAGFLISDKEALEQGVTKWAYDNDEDNKKLPAVKSLLRQRRLTITGLIILLVGLALEITSIFIQV